MKLEGSGAWSVARVEESEGECIHIVKVVRFLMDAVSRASIRKGGRVSVRGN